jgi:hypothetical protein
VGVGLLDPVVKRSMRRRISRAHRRATSGCSASHRLEGWRRCPQPHADDRWPRGADAHRHRRPGAH